MTAAVRVGLVGAGGIARTHARALAAMGVPVVVTSTGDSARRLAAEHGFDAVDSLTELLAAVDVVLIATPTPTHPEIALAAIAAGKDVICEKPLARTAAQAQRMVDTAETAGVRLFPAHVVRWFPEYVAVRDAAMAGEGIDAVDLKRSVGAPPAGSWFHDVEASGGIVLDLAVHDIDQAVWLAGPVAHVTSLIHGPHVAILQLGHAGGVLSQVEAMWVDEEAHLSTTVLVTGPGPDVLWEGVPDGDPPTVEGFHLAAAARDADPYRLMLEELLEARESGAPARVLPADGVHAVAVAEAAIASAELGVPVAVR